MRTPVDIGDAIEQISKLRTALLTLLDSVDYTQHACAVTEMIGACLPREILIQAHQALADSD